MSGSPAVIDGTFNALVYRCQWPVTHRTTNAPTSESAKRSDGHNSYE